MQALLWCSQCSKVKFSLYQSNQSHAELAAIAFALLHMGQEQDEIIATGKSVFALLQVYGLSPNPQQCKHKVMLEDSMARLLALQTKMFAK